LSDVAEAFLAFLLHSKRLAKKNPLFEVISLLVPTGPLSMKKSRTPNLNGHLESMGCI